MHYCREMSIGLPGQNARAHFGQALTGFDIQHEAQRVGCGRDRDDLMRQRKHTSPPSQRGRRKKARTYPRF